MAMQGDAVRDQASPDVAASGMDAAILVDRGREADGAPDAPEAPDASETPDAPSDGAIDAAPGSPDVP